VGSGRHLAVREADKGLEMGFAAAGRDLYLVGFYERLLDQGRRMLHLHFDYLERTSEGFLLTGEHLEMLEAIRARDVARADALAHVHTRQFRDNFLAYMTETWAAGMDLGAPG